MFSEALRLGRLLAASSIAAPRVQALVAVMACCRRLPLALRASTEREI